MGKILSVFIDESGDFGYGKEGASSFYVLSLVFHDQSQDIRKKITAISSLPAFHTGPLIRREPPFQSLSLEERGKMLRHFFIFLTILPIQTKSFVYRKDSFPDDYKMQAQMAKDLQAFLTQQKEFLSSFEGVIGYYDKGQSPITQLLNVSFALEGINVGWKQRVDPTRYRLYQVADFVATIRLLEAKLHYGSLSPSEEAFFTHRILKNTYLRYLNKIEMK